MIFLLPFYYRHSGALRRVGKAQRARRHELNTEGGYGAISAFAHPAFLLVIPGRA